jgi:hypothetical protein
MLTKLPRSLSLLLAALLLSTVHLNAQRQKDSFEASERADVQLATVYPENARVIRMAPGEIIELHQSNWGKEQSALFLVPEGRGVAQVLKEKKFNKQAYFIKALAPGETLAGIVTRKYLDGEGFNPKNEVMYARIQEEIKANPIIIVVDDIEFEKAKRIRKELEEQSKKLRNQK